MRAIGFAMTIKRRFIDLSWGQIHLRECGGGAQVLVMLHANPTSARPLEPLMARFARERRVLAPDTPGLGDSDPLPLAAPTIPDYAAAIGTAIDALGLASVALYGCHTGANLALELAVTRPALVSHLILDGIALYTPSERRELLAHYTPDLQPTLDGIHLQRAFHFVRDQFVFWPWYRREAAHRRDASLPAAATLHDWTVDVLKAATSYQLGYRASFLYEKEERFARLSVPTLVASPRNDIFADRLDAVLAHVPKAERVLLPASHDPAYLDAAVAVFARFLAR